MSYWTAYSQRRSLLIWNHRPVNHDVIYFDIKQQN
jgi:hypothetical protein